MGCVVFGEMVHKLAKERHHGGLQAIAKAETFQTRRVSTIRQRVLKDMWIAEVQLPLAHHQLEKLKAAFPNRCRVSTAHCPTLSLRKRHRKKGTVARHSTPGGYESTQWEMRPFTCRGCGWQDALSR